MLAAFSMKTTDSKDLVKVNQILPIMQEYFGKSMNLAGKNGVDCYSKNGHAVTVLTRQS